LKRDEFLRKSFHQLDIGRRPANFDLAVAALNPPELPKLLPKRRDRGLPFLVALGGERQDTDPANRAGNAKPIKQSSIYFDTTVSARRAGKVALTELLNKLFS